jgi:hypothetical protein
MCNGCYEVDGNFYRVATEFYSLDSTNSKLICTALGGELVPDDDNLAAGT